MDNPPNHAMFSMMHSVKVTKRNSLTDDFINYSQMTTYPQYPQYFQYPQQIYYPSSQSTASSLYNYSEHDSRRSSLISQISDQSLKKPTLNMKDFLQHLD